MQKIMHYGGHIQTGLDRLHKIHSVFDCIINRNRFLSRKTLTIDEGMYSFCECVSFRVYIKNKPNMI